MNNPIPLSRREFLRRTAAGLSLAALAGCQTLRKQPEALCQISLAEWSFHRALRLHPTMAHLDFPVVARQAYGITAVEYVNQFFKDKAKDRAYLTDLKNRCEGEGVRSLLIMCDGEGHLGDPDETRRKQAVDNHLKWLDAASFLGCHSIRVNAATDNVGSYEDQQKRAADGLRDLAESAGRQGLNVLVENHGGLSSHGAWLSGVMREVNLPNCGTLPDFGNFNLSTGKEYDRYLGVAEMMPFAKAVSAKSHDFDDQGNEIHTDYLKMLRIVLGAGYRGWIGIEYEGSQLSEPDGIRATQRLLEQVRDTLLPEFS